MNASERLEAVRDRLETGLDRIDHYRPVIVRYRWPILAAGAAVLLTVGVVMVARRRRRRPLVVRLQDALPDSVSDRLEKPLSSLRTRLSR
jgi:hypothetical protein